MPNQSPKETQRSELVEIILARPDSFLILRETLTRIGLTNKENTKLYQTCHILHKKGKIFLVHFKEMFILDGKPTNFTTDDIARRNSIINYLLSLKFFTLASGDSKMEPYLPHVSRNDDFTIISHEDKSKFELIPKYVIGSAKNKPKPKVKTAV